MERRILTLTHLLPVHAVYHSVSNTFSLEPRKGHSALYAAIASTPGVIHVGSIEPPVYAHTQQPVPNFDQTLKEDLNALLWKHGYIPVWLENDVFQGHYQGFCKKNLWPLLHYLLWEKATNGVQELEDWNMYCKVNERFVQETVRVYRHGDRVWIHDYHLCLAPLMIRQLVDNVPVGFFLHSPFPSSEVFRCLPKRKEILQGMLGANLIGFQTYSYARHFVSSCTRVLGLESTTTGVEYMGHAVTVATFPIGIDVDCTDRLNKSDDIRSRIPQLKEMYDGKRIIVGRDHLDKVKGVVHKMTAFEKFLQKYPEWRDQVALIQITNPRASNTAKLQLRISEQVSMINGQYGNLEFLPVHYHSREIRSEDYYALMNIADAALITSVRDGMNTMSYEWVVCQNDKATSDNGPGVLILSEFCGTAGSLSGALHINPWDVEGVADAIHDALRMPVENRRAKFALLDAHVRSYTASFWATCFLNELDQHSDEFECDPSPRVLDISSLSAAYTAAKGKRLFLFDYDGTLTPIRQFPHEAAPSPLALSALTKLAAHEQNYVWIISGRDQATLEAWINIPNVGLSAEHGCYIRSPRSTTWIDLTDGMDISWQEEVMRVFEYYTERTLGSFIERKKSSITWHYRQADPDFGSFQAKECQNHLEEVLGKMPVEVMTGKKNLEVRPAALNKGGIVGRLVRGHGQWCGEAKDDLDLIVCCGDDRTDEDMFKVLRRRRRKLSSLSEDERDEECTSTFCIAIGDKTKKTVASWRLPGAEQLVQVLSALE